MKKILQSMVYAGTMLLLALICTGCMHQASVQKSPELLVVENFYRSYFQEHGKITKGNVFRESMIPLSESFQKLIDQNEKVCSQNKSTDICGWGADGMIFLDSQEYDVNLNMKNSGFRISEPMPQTVQVTFNVYPSLRNSGDFYDKRITFLMVNENDRWVANDIMLGDTSQRKVIQDEIAEFSKK